MRPRLDSYETVGVAIPGSVLAFGAVFLFHPLRELLADKEIGVGGLGLFLIGALVLGHIVQALANVAEGPFWGLFGGMPSNWLRGTERTIVARQQRDAVFVRLRKLYGADFDPSACPVGEWRSVVCAMYAEVKSCRRNENVDAFNRNYGLMRGTATAFLLLALVAPMVGGASTCSAFCIGSSCICVYRAFRFARLYAQELFVQYSLPLSPAKTSGRTKGGERREAFQALDSSA